MIKALQEWVRSEKANITKNTLKVIGAYGIIQVFAQDIGVRTGCVQARVSQNIIIQIILFTSVAYSVTDDFFQSFSGTLIYFVFKYIFSHGRLNNVCFPNECDTEKCEKTS